MIRSAIRPALLCEPPVEPPRWLREARVALADELGSALNRHPKCLDSAITLGGE